MNDEALTAIEAALARAAGINDWRVERYDIRGYRRGYRALRRLLQNYLDLEDADTVLACANAIYGWMPRILSGVDWVAFDDIRSELAEIRLMTDRTAALAWVEQLTVQKRAFLFSFVNGSAVGTSKFLHFLNPVCFPIWDSRVARCLGMTNTETVRRPRTYARYLRLANAALDRRPVFGPAYLEFLNEDAIEPASDMRKLEYVLFLAGERKPADTLET